MADNTSRNVFGINGVAGMLIATVLLLSILVFLTVWGIKVQQGSSAHYYDPTPITGSLDNVKQISKDNAQHAFKDAQ
ncbi:MAG: DUF4006 family protein [Campylobacterales bacterium]|nr:DUF4006 family protein [Campylobacterales bacterium]